MDSHENNATTDSTADRSFRIKAGVFLTSVGAVSALVGFSKTLATAKRQDEKFLQEAAMSRAHLLDDASRLAMRALGWGTLYAILGTGAFCYGVWKLSGAQNFQEFRQKAGSVLPKLSSNDPPQSRTDFDGLTDLLKYTSTWGKE
ncbi:unnamed protein product [Hermetia illucens]|uniref:Transmembrane protein 242 n=1 Tax=Hermetia illucens TaxID=343691 RepID=A0A7R8U9N1_HERIL|nr:transmembrane protein 242 [Hermetia illucens]CAD7076716.1 unnamed protein product [Hermetia illucens]